MSGVIIFNIFLFSLLKKHLLYTCGKATCNINLVNSSKKKGYKKFKAESHCEYAINFDLRSAANMTKGMPCCNRPIFCEFQGCKRVIWSYNMDIHYSEAHDDETPEVFKISDEEKVSVLAFQC